MFTSLSCTRGRSLSEYTSPTTPPMTTREREGGRGGKGEGEREEGRKGEGRRVKEKGEKGREGEMGEGGKVIMMHFKTRTLCTCVDIQKQCTCT